MKYFLDIISKNDNSLYILGDFFDYWIGDDHLSKFNKEVIILLRRARHKGLKIFLMHGNKDFLIGKLFEKISKVTIIKDPYIMSNSKKRFIFTHGDKLDQSKKYYILTLLIRNRVIKYLFLLLNTGLRIKIAKYLSSLSNNTSCFKANYQCFCLGKNKLENNIIHGHIHQFNIQHKKDYNLYTMDKWDERGQCFILDSSLQITSQFFHHDRKQSNEKIKNL